MPAAKIRTELEKQHLKKLNNLPQTIANRFGSASKNSIAFRFRKGQPSWNNQGLVVACKNCGKKFNTNKSKVEHGHKFCSWECRRVNYPHPLLDKILPLYQQGLKYKDIAKQLNCTIGTIGSAINRAGRKNRLVNYEFPRRAIKSKLPNFCELCGFIRAVDMAHIVPRSKGGNTQFSNFLSLCPNCHHLFDHDLLTKEEAIKLSRIIEVRRYAPCGQ